jgi:ribonuclease HI
MLLWTRSEEHILREALRRRLRFVDDLWIPGIMRFTGTTHADHADNLRCDFLAQKAAREQIASRGATVRISGIPSPQL